MGCIMEAFSRVLLIRPGGIGDCITTFPAMEALRGSYTEIWTNPACIPLIDFADCIRCATARGILLLRFEDAETIQQIEVELRRFDRVVSWYGKGMSAVEKALSSVHPDVRFVPPLPDRNSSIHAIDFHLASLGIANGHSVPRVPYQWQGDGGFVAFQPFSSAPYKEWPLERFLDLETRFAGFGGVKWLVHPKRLPFAGEVEGELVTGGLDKVGEILARATLYVGNDTGISHLAAAIGVPSIVLFPREKSEVWAPRGLGKVICVQVTQKTIATDIFKIALELLER